LIWITRNFTNITNHFFGYSVLPFIEHAKEKKFLQAEKNTNLKKEELNKRTQDFEKWKEANKKKKKNRQAFLLGEIPKEQVEYEKDSKDLTDQINLLQSKQDFIHFKKELVHTVFNDLTAGSNQALIELEKCRIYMMKYGEADKHLSNEERFSSAEDMSMISNQRSSSSFLHAAAVNKYAKTIEELRQKGENFALVQALNEVGNLDFVFQKFSNAIKSWKESLDTIFQKLDSLSKYKEITKANDSVLAYKYGIQQCLIGCNLLCKLGYLCYYNNLSSQRDAILMASELCFSIFKLALPHPQIQILLSTYRLKEILDNEKIFASKQVLDPVECLLNAERLSWMLIDYDYDVKALAFLTIMEYISLSYIK